MFINEFENHNELQKIIVAELKRKGVKVKVKRLLQQIKRIDDKVETETLTFAPSVKSSTKILVEDDSLKIEIPKFLHHVVDFLSQKICTEFLLRKGGSAGRQRHIRNNIEDASDLSRYDVHDIACLLKQWLRELKEPLIPYHLHDIFKKTHQTADPDSLILLACLLLPFNHLMTMRYLLMFLNRISSFSDKNKMDPSNLAIVMAPNIMPCYEKSDKLSKEMNRDLQERRDVVEELIKKADCIGYIPDRILDNFKLSDYTLLKSSEDELEKSDESVLSSTFSNKKRSKKRKSLGFGFTKRLVNSTIISVNSRENLNKICTPVSKRKADLDLLSLTASKKKIMETSSAGSPIKAVKAKNFTPTHVTPNIQFSNTPVSEMCFNSTSKDSGLTPRRRRGSSRAERSGCFRTPKSRKRHRSAKFVPDNVGVRLANISNEEKSTANSESSVKSPVNSVPTPVTDGEVTSEASPITSETNRLIGSPGKSQESRITDPPSVENTEVGDKASDAAKMDTVVVSSPHIRRVGSVRSVKYKNSLRRSLRSRHSLIKKTPTVMRKNSTRSNLSMKGSIRRGRPNTIRTGLPSPYRPMVKPGSTEMDNSGDKDPSIMVEKSVTELGNIGEDLATKLNFKESDSAESKFRSRKSISTPSLGNGQKNAAILPRTSSCDKMKSEYCYVKLEPLKYRPTANISSEEGPSLCSLSSGVESQPKKALDDNSNVNWISGEVFFNTLQMGENMSSKRESVLKIKKEKAGHVKASVSKFNDISSDSGDKNPEFKTPIGIVPRTPRRRSKRGPKTPVRIPSVFVRNSNTTASVREQYIKECPRTRTSSFKGEPTSIVKQTATNRRHSSIYGKAVVLSPLRDSNTVNIRSSRKPVQLCTK